MHRFVDTFDDVISTAVATGVLGSGTASCALRGGVLIYIYIYFHSFTETTAVDRGIGSREGDGNSRAFTRYVIIASSS